MSPTPLIPVVALTFPSIHCIAPAWMVTGALLRSQTSWRLRTFIWAEKYAVAAESGVTLRSRWYSITWKHPFSSNTLMSSLVVKFLI